jgi:uncharacterized protein YciI
VGDFLFLAMLHPSERRNRMDFAVICLDRPGTKALRARTRLAHMEYINGYRPKMVMGGALLDDDGETRVGMMLAIDLPDRESVEQFMRNEPYNKAGIFETVLIRSVHKVFPEDDPSIFDNMIDAERSRAAVANRTA